MLIGHCTYNSCQPPWPEWLETPCLLPCKVYIGAPCMVNQIGQDRRAHFIMYMLHLLYITRAREEDHFVACTTMTYSYSAVGCNYNS